MPINVTKHSEGSFLSVRAQPGAKRNGILGEQNGALKVAVTAPAEEGRANLAITDLLRDWLGVRRPEIELAGGPTSRNKTFLVRGIMPDELRAIVEAKLANG